MAILGGALIGGAASLALLKVGYPVGISGFLSKAIGTPGSAGWRLSFLGGMLIVALVVGVGWRFMESHCRRGMCRIGSSAGGWMYEWTQPVRHGADG